MSAHILLFLLSVVAFFPSPQGLDPFTAGSVAGLGAVSAALYAGWEKAQCLLRECCHSDRWIPNNITRFEEQTRQYVFGQHIVLKVVTRAVRSHVLKEEPSKALVLSFHGWTGGGKNFVAKFLAESLYKKGMDSKYVHLFLATLHFPDSDLVDEYKLNLQDWIRGNVSQCAQTLFIFDETDKMPEGLLDAIKPFVDHHPSINGIDFRRAIFVFLSNTGGEAITQVTFNHWKEGGKRERLSLSDLEPSVYLDAFNESGGLRKSNILSRHLVDHFVPFLPLEKAHVRQCVKAAIAEAASHKGERKKNVLLSEKKVEEVLNELSFWPRPDGLFSVSGCKRVTQKVAVALDEEDEERLADGL